MSDLLLRFNAICNSLETQLQMIPSEFDVDFETDEIPGRYQLLFSSQLQIDLKLMKNSIQVRVAGELVSNRQLRYSLQLELFNIINAKAEQDIQVICDQVYKIIKEVFDKTYVKKDSSDLSMLDLRKSSIKQQSINEQAQETQLMKNRLSYLLQFLLAHMTNLSDKDYPSLCQKLQYLGLINEIISRDSFRNNPIPNYLLEKIQLESLSEALQKCLQTPVVLPKKWHYKNNFFNDNFDVIGPPLGHGTYGIVYHVRHKESNRDYAVKKLFLPDDDKQDTQQSSYRPTLENVLTMQFSQNQQQDTNVSDFINELKLLIHLKHPNIVQYFNAWIEVQQKIDAGLPGRYAEDLDDVTYTHSEFVEINTHHLQPPLSPLQHHFTQTSTSHTSTSNDSSLSVKWSSLKQSQRTESVTTQTDVGDSEQLENLSAQMAVTPIRQIANLPKLQNVVHIQMELCEKRSLFDLLYKNSEGAGILNDEIRLKITIELIEGLAYMHKNQVIHYDIKPENIFMAGKTFDVKYGDFGVSILGGIRNRTQRGTKQYMAPELESGVAAPPSKADIYSLGLVLFELWAVEFQDAHFRLDVLRYISSVAGAISGLKREKKLSSISLGGLKSVIQKAMQANSEPNKTSVSIFHKQIVTFENSNPDMLEIVLQMLERNHQDRPFIKDIMMNPYIFKQLQKVGLIQEVQAQIRTDPQSRSNMVDSIIKQKLDELEKGFSNQSESNLVDPRTSQIVEQDFLDSFITQLVKECNLEQNKEFLEQFLIFSSYQHLRNFAPFKHLLQNLEQFIFVRQNKPVLYLSYADNLIIYYIYKRFKSNMLFQNQSNEKQIQIILKYEKEFSEKIIFDSDNQFITLLNTIFKIRKEQLHQKKYVTGHISIKSGESKVEFNNTSFLVKNVESNQFLKPIWDGFQAFQFQVTILTPEEQLLCYGGSCNSCIQIVIPLCSFLNDKKAKQDE